VNTAPSGPTSFVQTEGSTVVNGVLTIDLVDIQGGYLGGSGTIVGNVIIGAGATMNPGNSPGTLTVNGDVTYGNLVIEIASLSSYDFVDVSGNVTFVPGSVVKFVVYDVYQPANNDQFEFLTANLIQGLETLAYAITGLPAGFGYQVYSETGSGGADLYVRFYSQAQGAAAGEADQRILYQGRVPEPSTTALSMLGLALLVWLRRRPLRAVRLI
jgi:hypothetical protein